MKVVIPIPRGDFSILSISGMIQLLEAANTYPGEHFSVELVHSHSGPRINQGRYDLVADTKLSETNWADLVIIPPLLDPLQQLENNTELLAWVKDKASNSQVQLASVCTGAYLLAEAGVLDKKEASSHWLHMDALRRRYPQVNWVPERILTDVQGTYTSGGAFSSFNLMLYLVEKFVSKDKARQLARNFEIDYPRQSQLPFMLFSKQLDHKDEAILQAQQLMEQQLHEDTTIEKIAQMVNMSRRNFIRRFKVATGNTPKQYWQRLRMEAAKRQFEQSDKNISEVMHAVGYADQPTFRRLFRQHTGMLPSAYRRKYG